MAEPAITVQNVSKSFKVPLESSNGLKQKLINVLKGRKGYRNFTPLNDISFTVDEGDFFGVVGRNGSGKSTLLKTLAGIYSPNKGEVHVKGKLVPFIELGVGFNPELTGRENVFLNGALLGFSRSEMNEMYDEIVDFAELHDFMEENLKNYSSGMQVRLAFSIAIRAKGDVLLLDEVLAVGDALFQQKCFRYFSQLKREKRTILLVSHDINTLKQYCTKGVLIEKGNVLMVGDIDDVTDKYIDIISEEEARNSDTPEENEKAHRGTGKVIVESAQALNSHKEPKKLFTDQDSHILIRVAYKAQLAVEKPVYGIIIEDQNNNKVFASNNLWKSLPSHDLGRESIQTVVWSVPNLFNTGEYRVSPAVADQYGSESYDWANDFLTFKVRKKVDSSAINNPEHEMIIE